MSLSRVRSLHRSAAIALVATAAVVGATPPASAQSLFQSLTGNVLAPAAAPPAATDSPAASDAPDALPDPDQVNWDALNDGGAPSGTRAWPVMPAKPARPLMSSDPTWNRAERPDGSAAVAVGTRLPTEWDARVGMDVNSADRPAPQAVGPAQPDQLLHAPTREPGSGVAWANVTFSAWPVDTALDARVDPLQEQGKLGTTLSRTVPLGDSFAVTLQNGYTLSDTLVSSTGPAATTRQWGSDGGARVNILPTGTSFSAAAKKSSADGMWLRSLSAEQKLSDHLNVTGAVSETASGAIDRSVKAGFKHSW